MTFSEVSCMVTELINQIRNSRWDVQVVLRSIQLDEHQAWVNIVPRLRSGVIPNIEKVYFPTLEAVGPVMGVKKQTWNELDLATKRRVIQEAGDRSVLLRGQQTLIKAVMPLSYHPINNDVVLSRISDIMLQDSNIQESMDLLRIRKELESRSIDSVFGPRTLHFGVQVLNGETGRPLQLQFYMHALECTNDLTVMTVCRIDHNRKGARRVESGDFWNFVEDRIEYLVDEGGNLVTRFMDKIVGWDESVIEMVGRLFGKRKMIELEEIGPRSLYDVIDYLTQLPGEKPYYDRQQRGEVVLNTLLRDRDFKEIFDEIYGNRNN